MENRTKAGKGYWQSGFGRGFKSGPVVYEIRNFFYAKDSKNWESSHYPLSGQLEGYVRVNKFTGAAGQEKFSQCSHFEHEPIKEQKMFSEMEYGEYFYAGNFMYAFRYFENGKAAATVADRGKPEYGTWEHWEGDSMVTIAPVPAV